MSSNNSLPVACALTPQQLSENRQNLLPGLIERALEVSDLASGVRLAFQSEPGVVLEIARVIEQEQGCCLFLHFRLDVEPQGGAIILEVTGPEGTRELLRTL